MSSIRCTCVLASTMSWLYVTKVENASLCSCQLSCHCDLFLICSLFVFFSVSFWYWFLQVVWYLTSLETNPAFSIKVSIASSSRIHANLIVLSLMSSEAAESSLSRLLLPLSFFSAFLQNIQILGEYSYLWVLWDPPRHGSGSMNPVIGCACIHGGWSYCLWCYFPNLYTWLRWD